jgi:hypothetical protein
VHNIISGKYSTLPIAKILSVIDLRAWVSMVSYLKKIIENKIVKRKNQGSHLEIAF